MARVEAVFAERPSGLRSGDRPGRGEHLQANPQTQTIFNQAMRDLSASISPAVAASFDWGQFAVVADIGGGIGAQLSSMRIPRIVISWSAAS